MADIFTPEERGALMARIKASGTKPERRLIQLVEELVDSRYELRTNVQAMPGRPDIVIPALRLILFADGCFFHVCPKHGRIPDSNAEYWKPKLERNRRRDAASRRLLRRMGYSVWRVWEHDLRARRLPQTTRRIASVIARRECDVLGAGHAANADAASLV